MKYLKLFNESTNNNLIIDLLVDILNDLCDDYDIEIKKNYQYSQIQISRGVDIIPWEILENIFKRAISHCYQEIGEKVYLSVNKYRYDHFIYDSGAYNIYLDVHTPINPISGSSSQKWFFNLNESKNTSQKINFDIFMDVLSDITDEFENIEIENYTDPIKDKDEIYVSFRIVQPQSGKFQVGNNFANKKITDEFLRQTITRSLRYYLSETGEKLNAMIISGYDEFIKRYNTNTGYQILLRIGRKDYYTIGRSNKVLFKMRYQITVFTI